MKSKTLAQKSNRLHDQFILAYFKDKEEEEIEVSMFKTDFGPDLMGQTVYHVPR